MIGPLLNGLTCVALFAAVLSTALLGPTVLASTLPGTDSSWDPVLAWPLAFYVVLFLTLAIMLQIPTGTSWPRLADTWRRFVRALGLVGPPGRGWAVLAAGVLGVVVSVALSRALLEIPALGASATVDSRHTAVAEAPAWVGGLYFALRGVPAEEVLYRGTLLLAAHGIRLSVRARGARIASLTVLLVFTSVWFGWSHLEWSLANAVTAGAAGLVYGGMALWLRSLWPSMIAHAGHNFAAALTW